MATTKVTVLMSVYNGEKYLKEAIDSILNQTFNDFEFLVVNDGSTDKTEDILQAYDDLRIKIINNGKNIGLTKSLNKGLKLAKGEYIARMDADDISMPGRLEREVEFLDKNPAVGLVGTYYLMINRKGNVLHTMKCLTESVELKEKLLRNNQFCHGSVMFRAECIKNLGSYREELGQDYDLWLRISENYEVANIFEFLYKWRLDINSISVTKKSIQDKYTLLAIELAKERRQFGKDRFQSLAREKTDKLLDDLFPKTQSRKEIAKSYYFWCRTLFSGKDYQDALKLLLKSFISDPMALWILILRDMILLPKYRIRLLSFVKLHLASKDTDKRESEA